MAVIEAHDQALIEELRDNCNVVYSPSFALVGPTAARAGVRTLHGVDPFQLQWSTLAISQAAGVELTGYSIVAPPFPPGEDDPAAALRDVHPDTGLLAALGVRWVASEFPIEDDELLLAASVGSMYLYEVHREVGLLGMAEERSQLVGACSCGPCGECPNQFQLVLPDSSVYLEPGVLVVPQAWAPGWRAWVDGESIPVQRVDGALMGMEIPSDGEHVIKLAYQPVADFVGMGITGASVLGLTAWGVARKPKGRVDA